MKLARHADDGAFDAPVTLVQVFSGYYDLAGGGVSSKRENATFVGRLAGESIPGFDYRALGLGLVPPKHGTAPENRHDAVAVVADEIAASL